MALRNAFDGIATETTLRKLFNNLNFGRDASDQLRVRVGAFDVAVNTNSQMFGSGTAGTYVGWYGSIFAPVSMDQREPMRAAARANALLVRNGRWTFS